MNVCFSLEEIMMWIIGGYLLTVTGAVLYVIWRLHQFLEQDGEIRIKKWET